MGCDKNMSEFKYMECVLDESGTDETKCSRKVASGMKVEGAMRSLVNTRGLQLEFCMSHCLCMSLCIVVR